MKACPVCGALAFDDAATCFGCLHAYGDGDPEIEEVFAEGAVALESAAVEEDVDAGEGADAAEGVAAAKSAEAVESAVSAKGAEEGVVLDGEGNLGAALPLQFPFDFFKTGGLPAHFVVTVELLQHKKDDAAWKCSVEKVAG